MAAIATALADARDPWWVIGSAAVALHGGDAAPRDVDVVMSTADAARLLPRLGIPVTPGEADERFRSALFARWTAPPLPVEFMAALHVAGPDGWTSVTPATRECVAIGKASVYIPSRAEVIAILHRFGRAKDHARAALLA